MTKTERFVGAVLGVFIIALGIYPLGLTKMYTDVSDNMAKQAATRLTNQTM